MPISFSSADLGDVKRLSHSPVWPQRFVSVYEVQRLCEQQQSDQSQLQVREATWKTTCPDMSISDLTLLLKVLSESQGCPLVLVVTTILSLWAAQRTSMCTSGAHTTTWASSPLCGETAMTSGKGSKVIWWNHVLRAAAVTQIFGILSNNSEFLECLTDWRLHSRRVQN